MIEEKIKKLVNEKYSYYNCISPESDEDFLEDEIATILKEYCGNNYSICSDTFFDSPGYDTGAISYAYIYNGELYHNMIQWERN